MASHDKASLLVSGLQHDRERTERWEARSSTDEAPHLGGLGGDLLALILWLAAPICGLLLLICVAPLDALGRATTGVRRTSVMGTARADDFAAGRLRPLLGAAHAASTSAGPRDDFGTPDSLGSTGGRPAYPRRDSSDEAIVAASSLQTLSRRAVAERLYAEHLEHERRAKQAAQLDLLRVVVLVFPPLARLTQRLMSSRARGAAAVALSPSHALRDWVLRYSTECHGCSLRTAYSRLSHCAGPTLLMVLDANGHRFGAFCTQPWAPSHRYFGTGESFLFKAHPGVPTVFPWTGANTHFQLAQHDSMAMGGGGHFGLWLDEAFEYGSSGPCTTYANPALGSDESFRILRVEIWELAGGELGAHAAHSRVHSPRTPEGGGRAPFEGGEHAGVRGAGAIGRAMAAAEADAGIEERVTRQGSSAFLLQMMPGRF